MTNQGRFQAGKSDAKGQIFTKFFSGAIVVNRLIIIDEYAKTSFPNPTKAIQAFL